MREVSVQELHDYAVRIFAGYGRSESEHLKLTTFRNENSMGGVLKTSTFISTLWRY